MSVELPISLLRAFNLSSPCLTSKQSGNINFVFRCKISQPSETKADSERDGCETKADSEGDGATPTAFLRLTPATFRARNVIEGELQWMEACALAGLPVAKPMRAVDSSLTVEAEIEALGPGKHTAVAFHSVGGRPAIRPDDFTPTIIRAWAKLVAQLHSSSQSFVYDANKARPYWSADRVIQTALSDTSPQTAVFRRRMDELVVWMESVPKGPGLFGLTHADLHFANFHVLKEDPAEIAVFDFDDSCYHWYVHDLAVAVTQLRKQGIEDSLGGKASPRDMGALEKLFLEEYFTAGKVTAENRQHMLDSLENFVEYRACLIMCWASRERESGALTGPVSAAWFTQSIPIYQKFVSDQLLVQKSKRARLEDTL